MDILIKYWPVVAFSLSQIVGTVVIIARMRERVRQNAADIAELKAAVIADSRACKAAYDKKFEDLIFETRREIKDINVSIVSMQKTLERVIGILEGKNILKGEIS